MGFLCLDLHNKNFNVLKMTQIPKIGKSWKNFMWGQISEMIQLLLIICDTQKADLKECQRTFLKNQFSVGYKN